MPSEDIIDFTHRADPADLPEWMDEPCSYEDFRACLVDLAQVNTLTFASRPTLDFLSRIASNIPSKQPLRIVDVGCGGGDMLRRIERWAAAKKVPVQLTGIDLNPYAARAAREFTHTASRIEWLTGNAFSYTEPISYCFKLALHAPSFRARDRKLSRLERKCRPAWVVHQRSLPRAIAVQALWYICQNDALAPLCAA